MGRHEADPWTNAKYLNYRFAMAKRFWIWVLAVLWMLCFWSPSSGWADTPIDIKIGILAFRGGQQAQTDWGATARQMELSLPNYRFKIVPGSLSELSTAVANHTVDFLITNPGHYFEMQVDYGASGLATAQDMDGTPATASVGSAVIVSARPTEIVKLEDLKGHKVAVVAPDAFSYRMAAREFQDHGIDLAKNTALLFTGYPSDTVVGMVQSGKADAGVIPACVLEKMVAEGWVGENELRVLGQKASGLMTCKVSSRLYPGWVFLKVSHTSEKLAQDVRSLLLTMQPGDGAVAWTDLVDYTSVQELYRELKVGPYERFRPRGMADFVWQNRYLAALFAMAAVWWLIHVVRVEHLIERRTRELQQAHAEARIRGHQMEHAVRLSLMGEMASSLAHEINQPLAAILNYARGCARRLESGTDLETVRQGVDQIAQQAERAGTIVRQMREFVRKRPSTQVMENIGVIIEDTMLLFNPVATDNAVNIDVDVPIALPSVRVDRVQIEEVLLNLLQNAVEAIKGHEFPAEPKSVQMSARLEGREIVVSVTDNGPGISPVAEAHLFDAFFTTKPEGLGLGLSLSRTIIESHGGRLWVDRQPVGCGCSFKFSLPIVDGGANA